MAAQVIALKIVRGICYPFRRHIVVGQAAYSSEIVKCHGLKHIQQSVAHQGQPLKMLREGIACYLRELAIGVAVMGGKQRLDVVRRFAC